MKILIALAIVGYVEIGALIAAVVGPDYYFWRVVLAWPLMFLIEGVKWWGLK